MPFGQHQDTELWNNQQVSRDHIPDLSVQLIEITCFFKLTADHVLVFDWIAGSCHVNLLKTRQDYSEAC